MILFSKQSTAKTNKHRNEYLGISFGYIFIKKTAPSYLLSPLITVESIYFEIKVNKMCTLSELSFVHFCLRWYLKNLRICKLSLIP